MESKENCGNNEEIKDPVVAVDEKDDSDAQKKQDALEEIIDKKINQLLKEHWLSPLQTVAAK